MAVYQGQSIGPSESVEIFLIDLTDGRYAITSLQNSMANVQEVNE